MAETRTFIFRSRPEAVSAARRALDGFDQMLDASVFYDASLCVSELVTNAVLHADIGTDDELRLDVAIDPGGNLRVSVSDTGRGFEPAEPSAGDESGWGLYIVDRLSHRWGVDRADGNSVWFEMSVAQRGPATDGASRDGKDPAPASADDGAASPRRRSVGRLRLGPQTTG